MSYVTLSSAVSVLMFQFIHFVPSTDEDFVFVVKCHEECRKCCIQCCSAVVIVLANDVVTLSIEQFSNDCPKTNTKVITPANHNMSKQCYEPIRIPSNHL